MDRRAWQATVHGGHEESDTTQQPSLTIVYLKAVKRVDLKSCHHQKKKKLSSQGKK